MSIDLRDLNDIYLSAQAGNLPNGVYPAKLMKAEVQYSKAGNRQIVWDLEARIPATGSTALTKKFSPLNKEQMRWVKSDLKKLGVTLSDINALHDALEGLTGSMIEIQVESDTDYHNVDFIRLISRQGL